MSKQKAIRDRKGEMISCWVCAAFVAIIYLGKILLIGFDSASTFQAVLLVLFVVWILIAVFYTVQYGRWKKKNGM